MRKLKQYLNLRAAARLAKQFRDCDAIENAVRNSRDHIPVLVICFNNGIYVSNMVKQLNERNILPIVIDNKSTDIKTIQILDGLESTQAIVLRSTKNLGHLVGFLEPIYKLLPETFAYTDPDLQFNPALPEDFMLQLANVADLYESFKAGMALDIHNSGDIRNVFSSTTAKYPFKFQKIHSLVDWESQFWKMPLKHDRLEVYAAAIDTTFAVYQKKFFNGEFSKGVRVAGEYTAVHLPWFQHLDILSSEDRNMYASTAQCSAWVKQ